MQSPDRRRMGTRIVRRRSPSPYTKSHHRWSSQQSSLRSKQQRLFQLRASQLKQVIVVLTILFGLLIVQLSHNVAHNSQQQQQRNVMVSSDTHPGTNIQRVDDVHKRSEDLKRGNNIRRPVHVLSSNSQEDEQGEPDAQDVPLPLPDDQQVEPYEEVQADSAADEQQPDGGDMNRNDQLVDAEAAREENPQAKVKQKEKNAASPSPSPPSQMSSCILYMDDNHWLIEWLAYHYTTLNLTKIVMAIDERSLTSPVTILDRWQGRIEFDLWNDSHFFADYAPSADETLQDINLARQTTFFSACMRYMKQLDREWVLFTDADEYVTINSRAQQPDHELHRPHIPPKTRQGSILEFLQNEYSERHTVCHSMGRLQFSPDVSPAEVVQSNLPSFANGSEYLTLRWLKPADDLVGPKNIVRLASVNASELPNESTHQHRVLKSRCPEAGHTWHRRNSLLQVYHYLGTIEQFNFRQDARNTLKWAGRNNRYQRYIGEGEGTVDDLRPWLQTFVDIVGSGEAQRLLEGVGRVEGWPSAEAHQDRFAPVPLRANMAVVTKVDIPTNEGIIYSNAKTDRSGAMIVDMLQAHAYAYSQNKTYGGACEVEPSLHRESAQSLIDAIGLEDILSFACPEDSSRLVERREYASFNTRLFTAPYLQFLRSRVRYPATRNGGAVLHIRRGDITPCCSFANRYLPNQHFTDILKEYVPPNTPVYVYSETDNMETWVDFANATLRLDTDLSSAWRAMMTADYLALSKSSFSFVPAMLNPNGTILYTQFMQHKLPGWITVSDKIMDRSEKRVYELVDQLCSAEEKKVALQKIG